MQKSNAPSFSAVEKDDKEEASLYIKSTFKYIKQPLRYQVVIEKGTEPTRGATPPPPQAVALPPGSPFYVHPNRRNGWH